MHLSYFEKKTKKQTQSGYIELLYFVETKEKVLTLLTSQQNI